MEKGWDGEGVGGYTGRDLPHSKSDHEKFKVTRSVSGFPEQFFFFYLTTRDRGPKDEVIQATLWPRKRTDRLRVRYDYDDQTPAVTLRHGVQ